MLPSCSTDGTDVKRDCPLLGDAGMKLFDILWINVKYRKWNPIRFFDKLTKKFTGSITVRNPHLERLQPIALMYETELYSSRRYKNTHFQTSMISFHDNTAKPLLSYLRRRRRLVDGCREGVSGTWQLAHSSSFWPVIGTLYILYVSTLIKIREVSLYKQVAIKLQLRR